MSITRGNADNYITDEMTVSGRNISIKITETGYYWIDVEGVGDKLDLCSHKFTSLSEARKAVSQYVHENAGDIAKKKMIIEITERGKKSAKSNTE